MLMMLSSCEYSFAGLPADSVPQVPIYNIRSANAIYYHQLDQLGIYKELCLYQAEKSRLLSMAVDGCLMERQLSDQVSMRMSLQIDELRGIVHQQKKTTWVVSGVAALLLTGIILK